MLKRIALHFKRKLARSFLQELFGERITVCLIERLPWAWSVWTSRAFHVMKRDLSIQLDIGTEYLFLCVLLYVK